MTNKVVLVDDTDDIRLLLRMFIDRDPEFEVVGEARNGKEGIDQVRATAPDVVLLDIAMPVMDGLQALPLIREVCPNAAVIILSGFTAQGVAKDALALGAVAYLEKGAPPDVILEAMRQHVSADGASASAPEGIGSPSTPEDDVKTDEAFAVLSHELLNIVTPIVGLASLLEVRRDSLSDATMNEITSALVRNGRQLENVLSRFLAAHRAGSEPLDVKVVQTDVDALVRDIAADLSTTLTAHRITLDAGSRATVLLDPTRVRQIIVNLISNAAKFSNPGDDIAIETSADSKSVFVSVRDKGIGIPADRHGDLFQKYSRLDSTTGGNGIGLYVSKAIAEKHRGDLLVESQPGQGSCFTLVLPLRTPNNSG